MSIAVTAKGGTCLMGGATEDDHAMRWFLEQSNGGDILVLRASGSDGYNDYLYSELGVGVNSVETIVCHSPSCSQETYIHRRIIEAEAIWLAGGNQATYIEYWRKTAIDSLINAAINDRAVVVGGTSAGMAVLGGYYFTAENGTITSEECLSNPFDDRLTVDTTSFFAIPYLANTVTDTHFDNPDRRGRLVSMLARLYTDHGIIGQAIACEEYTAVCIDQEGQLEVFGGYPQYDDRAYLVTVDCELLDATPQVCEPNQPLHWSTEGAAVKACAINGTASGGQAILLNEWLSKPNIGEWQDWSVEHGVFDSSLGEVPSCNTVPVIEDSDRFVTVYPTVTSGYTRVVFPSGGSRNAMISIRSPLGILEDSYRVPQGSYNYEVDLSTYPAGLYYITIHDPTKGNYISTVIVER